MTSKTPDICNYIRSTQIEIGIGEKYVHKAFFCGMVTTIFWFCGSLIHLKNT